jgi:catechol 2,3-dioxygenase
MPRETSLHPDVRVGQVHLRVGDLERATAFYRDAIGLSVTVDGRAFGLPAVFLAAGDYHHHVALNAFDGEGAEPALRRYAGLHHFALLYPSREELGLAVARLRRIGHPIDAAEDHGGTVAVYLRDPDGNGVELSYDRPRSEWFDDEGRPIMKAAPFDPDSLIQEPV